MVCLVDLTPAEREHLIAKTWDLAGFTGRPWVSGPALARRRVAIITTSGIHRIGDRPFADGASAVDYRVISRTVRADELVMSHLLTNFDRTGFQQDVNVVFPIDRLHETAADSAVGSVADFHYSFIGAAPVRTLEPKARELGRLLKRDGVDAALLTPV